MTSPRFSLVTAVYGVVDYLPAFIAAVDAQDVDPSELEIVAVDDGSTDGSAELLARWADRADGRVRVVSKPNGGQGSARNLGIEHARGEWVTFTDPDDLLDPDYFSAVGRFLQEHPETEMVGTARWMLDDRTGELTDTHPLAAHFRGGDRLVDLDEYRDKFHGSAPAAFFRRARLVELGTRFDDRVQPNFEDGHFCTRYLLACPRPLLGFVASARYHYRKRTDGSSTLGTSLQHPGRYTDVLRYGYLDVLRASQDGDAGPPKPWVQAFVLYELSYYFSTEERHAGTASAAVGEVADEHHDLMAQIAGLLSPEMIEGFRLKHFARAWRHILLHGYRDDPWCSDQVTILKRDPDQDVGRASYYYTGRPPAEVVSVRGRAVSLAHAKRRDVRYHGRVLLHERILWIPLRWWVSVRLDGRDAELHTRLPELPRRALTAQRIRADLDPDAPDDPRPRSPEPEPRGVLDRLLAQRSVLDRWAKRFEGAWVLMDRIHDADDSAERLFRYLRSERPQINAWFVLEKGTPDWIRLRGEGYGPRLVAHGSLRWKLLMSRCRHLVSSHADEPIIRPPAITAFMRPAWRFTFLQHGVIKDDISSWLNPKPIDLFVTSTVPEHESIVADGTNWRLTTKEVRLTGLPRFDRLLEKGRAVPEDRRDLVLVCPTWRNWLLPPLASGSQRRQLGADFLDTQFAREWLQYLRDPDLHRALAEQGLSLGFLPHPNLQSALGLLDLPPEVRPFTFTDDVQQLFARAAVMVTDYSSMAFNAAYIDRPVVYFQFDRAEVDAGAHVGRAGYFEYERDGFGPVTTDAAGAVAATCEVVRTGRAPAEEYRARVEATFPVRDGRCCERVTDEIKRSTRRAPVRWAEQQS